MKFCPPLENRSLEDCEAFLRSTEGGTFPVGANCRTWHTGIHLQATERVCAIAKGKVVAYRFDTTPQFSHVTETEYSRSFVLLSHEYQSPMGAKLPFFSLYMHLESKDIKTNPPSFLRIPGYKVVANNPPGMDVLLLWKDEKNTAAVLPFGAKLDVLAENADGSTKVKYTAFVGGSSLEGIIKSADDHLELSADRKNAVVVSTPDSPLYKGSPRGSAQALKGISVYRETAVESIVATIPKGMNYSGKSVGDGWVELVSHPLNLDGTLYVKPLTKEVVSDSTSGVIDQTRLDKIVVPEKDKQPQVNAGEVIGQCGKIYHTGKPGIHFEIFTTVDLEARESILFDPKNDGWWATPRYHVPAGTPCTAAGIAGYFLKAGDLVAMDPAQDGFVCIRPYSMIRTVAYGDLTDYKKSDKAYTVNGNSAAWKALCGLADAQTRVKYVSQKATLRTISLTAAQEVQFWVRDASFKSEETAHSWNGRLLHKLTTDIGEVYRSIPAEGENALDDDQYLIGRPSGNTILLQDGNEQVAVDASAAEPRVSTSWPGFHLLKESNADSDAFIDLSRIKSWEIEAGAWKETERFRKTIEEINTSDASMSSTDLAAKIKSISNFGLFRQAIIQAPSEWAWNESRWSRLRDILQSLNVAEAELDTQVGKHKEDAKAMSWWNEVKLAATPSIAAFHPLEFIEQMNEVDTALAASAKDIRDLLLIAQVIEGNPNWKAASDEAKRGIARCLRNRPGKAEFASQATLQVLLAKYNKAKLTDTMQSSYVAILRTVFRGGQPTELSNGTYLFFEAKDSAKTLEYSVLEPAKEVGGWRFYRYKKDPPASFASVPDLLGISIEGAGKPGVVTPKEGILALQGSKGPETYYLNCREGSQAKVKCKAHWNWPATMIKDLKVNATVEWKQASGFICTPLTLNQNKEFEISADQNSLDYQATIIVKFQDGREIKGKIGLERDECWTLFQGKLTCRDSRGNIVAWSSTLQEIDITLWYWRTRLTDGKFWLHAWDLDDRDDFDFKIATDKKGEDIVLSHEIDSMDDDKPAYKVNAGGEIRTGKVGFTDLWNNYMIHQAQYDAMRIRLKEANGCVRFMVLNPRNDTSSNNAVISSRVIFSNSLTEERKLILSEKSIRILTEAASDSGHECITVTSTIRYPIQQATAMYDNLVSGNRIRYAQPGQAVTAVYDNGVTKGLKKEAIINSMVEKINELAKDGKRVSLHCVPENVYRNLNVVDISTNKLNSANFINSLVKNKNVVRILHAINNIQNTNIIQYLQSEPCIHVEINQI